MRRRSASPNATDAMPSATNGGRLDDSPWSRRVVAQGLLEQIEVRTQERRYNQHHEIDDDADEHDERPAAGEAIPQAHQTSRSDDLELKWLGSRFRRGRRRDRRSA